MFLPTILANYFTGAPPDTWYYKRPRGYEGNWIQARQRAGWRSPTTASTPVTFAFTYFYTAITFEVTTSAENLKRYSKLHPRHPPGKPTGRLLSRR